MEGIDRRNVVVGGLGGGRGVCRLFYHGHGVGNI